MNPPPDGEDYSSDLSRIDRDEDLVANYWRMHRPATYSEEHAMVQRPEPFVQRQQRKIAPAISSPRSSSYNNSSSRFSPSSSSHIHPNTTVKFSPPISLLSNSDDKSRVSIPLKSWQKSPIRNSRSAVVSLPTSLDSVTRAERPALCLRGSLTRQGQKSRQRTKESLKDKERSDSITDASESNNEMPPNSSFLQETPPGSTKSIPDTNNDSINTTPDSISSSCADNTADSYDSTQPQPSASTHQRASDSNNDSSGNRDSEHPKKQRPGVPRIIIPDGTSINLSTPPTTPRQQPRQISSRQMPVPIWPDRVIEFRDRMRASERMALFNWSKPTAPTTEQDAQADHTAAMDPDTTAEAETTPNTAPQEADPVSIHLSFSPAFGILGIPHYGDGTAESETSSQRHIWWDYDDEDESYGGWCSKERWHHVFCTRPGLTNTGKRLVTTTLGLVVILALALTALGKIRHRNRVSDMIPESLEGKVYEAHVMVIEDFHEKIPTLEKQEQGQGQGQGQVHGQGRNSRKVPFWEHPLGASCFQQRCETMAWKEFVAFMNPESFGIQLPQNWPSLCSSCIEISRNRFVYRTTVRVLGDLSQCAPTSTFPPAPSSPLPSVPSTLPHASSSKVQSSSKTGRITPSSKKHVPQNHGHGTHAPKTPTTANNTSKPTSQTPSRKPSLLKRQVALPPQGETLPSLIVDPATFNNLTEYDSVNAIQSMKQLRVQFRFVLCDD